MAKKQIFNLRTGRYATVTVARVHENMARDILNWIAWMILNNIRRFSDLTPGDFEEYAENICYGPGNLLSYSSRLTNHLEKLKSLGQSVPRKKCSNAQPLLNATKLLTDARIDPRKAWVDKPTAYILIKIGQQEGFYLSPKQRRKLKQDIPIKKKLAIIPILRMLEPWDYHWRMREVFKNDYLQFNPFEDVAPDKMATELGKEQGRTQTPPIQQTNELIDFSLRWIFDYAPTILDIRDKFDEMKEGLNKKDRLLNLQKLIEKFPIPDGIASPFPLYPSTKREPEKGITFGTAFLDCIPIACFVVIAAFTGRRLNEVLSIRAVSQNNTDCIIRNSNGIFLETYIEKTVKDWIPTPCNEVVSKAVDILRHWSAPARAISDDPSLFQVKNPKSNEIIKLNLRKFLEKYVNCLAITPLDDGSKWNFKPHQFRRFFAVMYYWQYQYRNLSALSYHLRHISPEMTKIYVTEVETGAIFRSVGREFTSTILTEAVSGERNISGPFGERFKKLFRKLIAHHSKITKIMSPAMMNKWVEQYAEKKQLDLKGFKWGYCVCGATMHELRSAKCLIEKNSDSLAKPEITNSSASTCGDCPHHLTEDVFAEYWLKEIDLHEAAAKDVKNGILLRNTSQQHAVTLKRQYERSFLKSKPIAPTND